MTAVSIHRIIEQHASARGDVAALIEGTRVLTYRDLNVHANAVARYLIGCGFRCRGHALVRLPVGVDLAVVLLAVLKAGGSYTWFDSPAGEGECPDGVSIAVGRHRAEEQFVTVDVDAVLAGGVSPGPNLPILARGSDIACVLPDCNGTGGVMVPHQTVLSLGTRSLAQTGHWAGEGGALDLWAGLIAGMTVTVRERISPQTAAA